MNVTVRFDDRNKIPAIKTVRDLTELGLKDSKDLVEGYMKRGIYAIPLKVARISTPSVNAMFANAAFERGLPVLACGDVTVTKNGAVPARKKNDPTIRMGNHVFEFPKTIQSEVLINQLRQALNSRRFVLRVNDHGAWLGVKIHKAKGAKPETAAEKG